jgi:L-lactate dehydrogenase
MKNKVTIIGAGQVGSTLAYSLISQDIAEEIALIDINEQLVNAQVMDLQHAVPFFGSTQVKVGSSDDYVDSKIVAICCGAAQKPGQSRLELLQKNSSIIRKIIPEIFNKNEKTIVIMITNPVDILTYLAISLFPDKKNQIMGTGTILDSARFRHLIGEKLNINRRSIHAYIIGEHGDSELPLWSTAAIGNMNLNTCQKLNKSDKEEIFKKAKNAAYTIIEGKKSTSYAIGGGGAHLIKSILYDKKTVLPVSHFIENQYNIQDVCLSTPVVIGRDGIINQLCLNLNDLEIEQLQISAKILKEKINQI